MAVLGFFCLAKAHGRLGVYFCFTKAQNRRESLFLVLAHGRRGGLFLVLTKVHGRHGGLFLVGQKHVVGLIILFSKST